MNAIFHALNTPRRREILRLVWDQERCVGDLCSRLPDVTMGAISQHLRVLEAAGLVRFRGEGVRRFYVARKEEMGSLQTWLESMWDTALYRLKIRAEMEEARRGPQPRKKGRKKK